MSRWFDKAVEQLEAELSEGEISSDEYEAAMRDLRQEMREEANEKAVGAYNEAMGYDHH